MFGAVRRNGIGVVATVGLLLIVGAPLIMVVAGSFRGPADFLPFDKATHWTFANYIEVFSDREFWDTLHDTGVYSLGSVLIALGFGITIGWLVGRTDLPGRRVVFLLMLVPITMPPVISAMSWLMLLGTDTGYVNVLLRSIMPSTGLRKLATQSGPLTAGAPPALFPASTAAPGRRGTR